jgi:malate-CoA ligase subunit beta
MDIHEYQAKALLSDFGMPIAKGGIAYSPEQAAYRAKELGGEKWVVKAQVHSGARGKAGGIKVCSSEDEVMEAANSLLGRRLVTNQTGPQGKLIGRLYIEEATDIEREIYLAFVLDRSTETIACVASAAGGMDIEEIAASEPDSIVRVQIEPAVGMQDFQAREIAFALGMEAAQLAEAVKVLKACYRAFRDLDATMVEINPLVVTREGRLIALDAKMGFDDNALFRRPQISELRDKSQEDPREMNAGLHHQRRRARHGDHGHDQARRRGTGEFSRYRRRRLAGAGRQGLQPGALGPGRKRDPGQHLRRYQSLRLGRRRRGPGDAETRRAGAGRRQAFRD